MNNGGFAAMFEMPFYNIITKLLTDFQNMKIVGSVVDSLNKIEEDENNEDEQ